jgi:serine/threonine protein kinase
MGNCNFKSSNDSESIPSMSKASYTMMYAIGRGGFGKVWRCEHRKDKAQYAMKEMAKARIITKKSVQSVMNELIFVTIISS